MVDEGLVVSGGLVISNRLPFVENKVVCKKLLVRSVRCDSPLHETLCLSAFVEFEFWIGSATTDLQIN